MTHNQDFIEGFAEGSNSSIETAIENWEWFSQRNPCCPSSI